MHDPRPILELEKVAADAEGYDVGLHDINLVLNPGDLAMVLLQRPHFNVPLSDVCGGLNAPGDGTVKFCGREWSRMLATRAGIERGRIGRVFHGRAWVSNLDIDENILLPKRHHSSQSDHSLRNEAVELAKHFGLPGLPDTRPAATTPRDLLRAAAVRAFLGKPDLLLLERPEHGLFPEIMPPLISALDSARSRGAAAVWLTNLTEVFAEPSLKPTAKFEMDGPAMKRLA